jgi:hypothetical protein
VLLAEKKKCTYIYMYIYIYTDITFCVDKVNIRKQDSIGRPNEFAKTTQQNKIYPLRHRQSGKMQVLAKKAGSLLLNS